MVPCVIIAPYMYMYMFKTNPHNLRMRWLKYYVCIHALHWGAGTKLNISIYMHHFTDGSCVFMPNHSFLNSKDIYTKLNVGIVYDFINIMHIDQEIH